jgi:hypothetical protein
MFAVGLLTLAASGILVGLAVRRSRVLPQWSGAAYALGFVLFLPQFFTAAPVRIGHGVLMAVGCLWLAAAMTRASTIEVSSI